MVRISYLNQRFLFGKGQFRKASSDTDVSIPTQLSRGVNEMCQLVPWASCTIPMVMKRFKDQWFGKFLRTPNWYLPVHLGGLGFNPDFGPAFQVTRQQRIVAAMFYHNPSMVLYRMKSVDIGTAKYYGSVCNPRLIPGDYVPEEHEAFDVDDEWLARLAYAARAHHGVVKTSDAVFLSKFKRDYRMKPMSLKKIELLKSVRWIQTKLPSCPPVNILH